MGMLTSMEGDGTERRRRWRRGEGLWDEEVGRSGESVRWAALGLGFLLDRLIWI
jgi:hypothetical protein